MATDLPPRLTRSSLVCPEPVGREAPLRALLAMLDQAIGGEGNVLLLGGAAGVGKSRLVRDFKHEATKRGVRVIEGRCSSAEASVPYAPLMDALRFRIARGEGRTAAEMLGPLRGVLAPLFPQLESEGAAATDQPAGRPFELIYRVLERLVIDEPMVLVLEDVHWADQTSLEVLHYFARRVPGIRLLVIATYRSDELHASHPLRRLLATLARERTAAEMQIEPLDREETTEMLRRMLGCEPDPAFAAAIWRRSEGNPFFVEELVTAIAEDGQLAPTAAAAEALARTRLPSTVSEAVLDRVHALGAREAEVLAVAAVIGRTVEFEVLRDVIGASEEDLVALLERLVEHQLLREEPAGESDRYAFPHALMQEALYESIISRRRRMLHRAVAAAMERQPAGRAPTLLDELAYHCRLGGDHEKAYEYARRAGDEAARLRAWDDAAAHYEHALAALEQLEDDGTRAAELLELLADVAWRQSNAASGRQYVDEALRLRGALGHKEDAARLLRRLAELRQEQGDHTGATSRLDEALRLLESRPESPELGPIYDDLGRLSLDRGDAGSAERLLLRGLSHATRDTAGGEEALALVSLGELAVLAADVEAGVTRMETALELVSEERLPFERAAQVYETAVRALLLAHEYERALACSATAAMLCRQQGVLGLDGYFVALHAVALSITLPNSDPLSATLDAVQDLRRTQRIELRDALSALGSIHLTRGDADAARAAYEEAVELGDHGASAGVGMAALAQGNSMEAARRLEDALLAVGGSEPLRRRQLIPHMTEALLATDRLPDAARLLESEELPDDSRAGRPELLYATGLVRVAEQRLSEARAVLEEAVGVWEELGNQREATRTKVALLATLLANGDTPAGLALGRQLLKDFSADWMPRQRETVRRLLRRTGVRTPPSTRAPTSVRGTGLTSREAAVLREVAHGHTNREIAELLGIAEKTVSVHVSHILAKLGCRTRTQAARFAR